MNPTVRTVPFLLFCVFPSLWAASDTSRTGGVVQTGSAHRDDVRRTVETHRAAQRDEVRRGEAAAGRRLTPAELAELRSQVRQQWSLHLSGDDGMSRGVSKGVEDVSHKPVRALSGGAGVGERRPAPASVRSLTMPRSQRE